MTQNDSLHLKPDGLIAGTHPRSGNLPQAIQPCRKCVYRNTASTFTFTPLGNHTYAHGETVRTEQQTTAIPSGSGHSSAIGRATTHHTTTIMTNAARTSNARRARDLRHGVTKARRKAGANQREEASQDVSLGARDPNCTRAFSSGSIKPSPATAAGLLTGTPNTRPATSNASNNQTTHGCHEA